ncbi:MAG: hypothetical protein WBK77_01315 [Alphaproteobacteria bacterium]
MFDVKTFSFGIPEIEAHIHDHVGSRTETIEGQFRLLKKWLCNRDSLHAVTRLSHDEISSRQLQQISVIVDNAYSTHPFYNRLYKSAGFRRGDVVTWDDYNALPTISKNDIIDNYDMFTTALSPDPSQIYTQRTSGSSGKTLQIMRDPTMTDHHALWELRFTEQMLGRRRDPTEWCYMSYLACPPYTSLDGKYPFFTVSNDCPPEHVLKHLKLMKPALLSGFPSYLGRLSALVDDPKELGIKAILTNSEACTKAERVKIGERMGAPVFDEYSSVELSYIATECKEGRYHIVEDNVRVDVLNPDSEGMGEIVATNLVNTYTPFIRYRQGDIIQIAAASECCDCGNKFRHFQSFQGRTDQFLQSQTIGLVPPDRVMALYDRTLIEAKAKVAEFQIIQTKLDEVRLLIIPESDKNGPDKETIQTFVTGLKDLFKDPNLRVNVEEVRAMPPSRSHKRRLIENRIQP